MYNEPENSIVVSSGNDMTLDAAKTRYFQMVQFIKATMRDGIDYGKIPGTAKPSLYKPGAEKLQMWREFQTAIIDEQKIEQWNTPITAQSFPLFSYSYKMRASTKYGIAVAECIGNCNSYEDKYRWRWVDENNVPREFKDEIDYLESRDATITEFAFALSKRETEGKYGKPLEYWDNLQAMITSGVASKIGKKTRDGKTMDAWTFPGKQIRIPNTDIYSQVNTLMKMAQKRAYVGTIIISANASEFFTQDIEDYAKKLATEDEVASIYTFVPTLLHAKEKMIDYVASRGIEQPTMFVKNVLDHNKMAFDLAEWDIMLLKIDDAIEIELKERQ